VNKPNNSHSYVVKIADKHSPDLGLKLLNQIRSKKQNYEKHIKYYYCSTYCRLVAWIHRVRSCSRESHSYSITIRCCSHRYEIIVESIKFNISLDAFVRF